MPGSSKKKKEAEAEEAVEDGATPKKRGRRESAPPSAEKGEKERKGDKGGRGKSPKSASKGDGKGRRGRSEEPEGRGGESAEGKKDKKEGGGKDKKDRKKEKSAAAAAAAAEPTGVETKVHLARFLQYQPPGVMALAHDAEGGRLAVARSSGDIQVWSTALPRWHPVAACAGSPLSQVRALCWSRHEAEDAPGGARLFSASLDGHLTEWCLGTLAPKHTCDTHGGSAWCMAASPDGSVLAVGCHDGMCRLFKVTADYGPVFHRALPPHPGQVLSVAWHPEGTSIATGDGASRVRIYNLATMTCTHTVGVGVDLGDRGKASMVWCVRFLEDMTVFAGDSKGRTHVIDGRAGVVVRDFSAHHGGDILSMDADENEVFSAGVDGRIVHYRRVKDHETGIFSWVITGAARFHTHDVRAVCVAGRFCPPHTAHAKPGQLPPADPTHPQGRAFERARLNKGNLQRSIVAGGIDTQLSVYTYERVGEGRGGGGAQGVKPVHRLPPWPHARCVRFSKLVQYTNSDGVTVHEVRMLSFQHDQADLWRWPVGGGEGGGEVKEPRYAVKIHTWAQENVRCAALSPCGGWVLVSYTSKLAAFRISVDSDDTLDVSKEALPPALARAAANEICFSPGGRAVLACAEGRLLVVDLASLRVECSFRPSDYKALGGLELGGGAEAGETSVLQGGGGGGGSSLAVTMLDVSPDGQWLASCDLNAVVHIFNLQGDVYHATLPTLPARMTCMRFVPTLSMRHELVCVTAENRFYIFDVEACRLTDWSRQFHAAIPTNLLNFPLHIMGVAFSPTKQASFLLQGPSFLCNIDLDKLAAHASATPSEDKNKKRKWTKEAPVGNMDSGCRMIHKYGPVLAAEYVSEGNLVIVERQWLQVLEQLGGTYYRKRYGK